MSISLLFLGLASSPVKLRDALPSELLYSEYPMTLGRVITNTTVSWSAPPIGKELVTNNIRIQVAFKLRVRNTDFLMKHAHTLPSQYTKLSRGAER